MVSEVAVRYKLCLGLIGADRKLGSGPLTVLHQAQVQSKLSNTLEAARA